MNRSQFEEVVSDAESTLFCEIVPRYLKQYGEGPPLIHQMIRDMDGESVLDIINRVELRAPGWFKAGDARYSRRADKARSSLVILVHDAPSPTPTYGTTFAALSGVSSEWFQKLAMDLACAERAAEQQKVYGQLEALSLSRRLACFSHSVSKQTSTGIVGQPLDTRILEETRAIELYFHSWEWLNEQFGGQLFSDQAVLTNRVTLTLFHEFIHYLESFPEYPASLALREETELQLYKAILRPALER